MNIHIQIMKDKLLRIRDKALKSLNAIYGFYAGHKLLILIALSVILLVAVFALNHFTPLLADDYSYSFVLGLDSDVPVRLTTVGEIIQSQIYHYFGWGGRSVAHFFAQLFLLWGKPVFNVVNSLVYVIFIFLIYFHANAYRPINIGLFVISGFLVWFFTPAYGETTLWLVGSCNYLWGTVFILLFLLPYRLYLAKPDRFKMNAFQMIPFALLGIIAGWTNENTAGAMILAICLFMLLYRKQKTKIPVWSLVGLCTGLIGYIIMIASPGNYERAATVHNSRSIFVKIIFRGAMITQDTYFNLYLLFFVLAILFILYANTSGRSNLTAKLKVLLYFVVSLSAAYCMVLNPGGFPQRAWFGVMAFMYIAIGALYVHLSNENAKIVVQLKRCTLLFAIIPLCVSYWQVCSDAIYVSNFIENRINYIEEQKKQGNLDVEVEHIIARYDYNPRYTYDDVDWDSGFYGNFFISTYYGINSIKAVKESKYSFPPRR